MGLALVFQNHLPVAVTDFRIHFGRVVNATVGKGGESRRHLHGTQAVGQAAHGEGSDAHILRHQTQPQLFRGVGVGIRHAQRFQRLDGDGVDRPPDAFTDHGPAGVGVGGVLGPGIAVEQMHRIVVKGGSRSNRTCIQRGRIHRQGLDGGTHLMLLHRVVIHQILSFRSHGAHHGHNVPGVGIHNGDAGLELFAGGGMDVQIAGVLINALGNLLNFRIHGAVDLIAAVIDQPLGGLIRHALRLCQIVGNVLDELLDKPVVDLNAVSLHHVAGVAGGVREVQRLRLGGRTFFRGKVGLAGIRVDDLRHLVQNQLLPLLVQLPRGDGGAVLPGVGAVIFGVVKGRVVGDGDDAGALSRRQILGGLTEIVFRRRFHAGTAAAQIDHVQVQLQDLALGVIFLKFQRPEDLLDLAVNGVLIFAGHVFQHLLSDGGAAVAVVAADEGFHGSAQRPLPVHAVVAEKALVLNGHRRLPQIGRHIADIHQNPVFLSVNLLVFHPLPAVLVLIVDHGALGHGIVLCLDVQRRQQGGVYILHKDAEQHRSGAAADQDQRQQRHKDTSGSAADPSARFSAGMNGRFLRLGRSSFVQIWDLLLVRFSKTLRPVFPRGAKPA